MDKLTPPTNALKARAPSQESVIQDAQTITIPHNQNQFIDCPMPQTTEIKAMLELLMVTYINKRKI
jgi:hypothetical protein